MIFKNLRIGEVAILIFTPVAVISTFFVTSFLQDTIEFSLFYINRILFIAIGVFTIIYVMDIKDIVNSAFLDTKTRYKTLTVFLLSFLGVYYISTFIHPIVQDIFFLNILGISLAINIVLSLVIALIIKGLVDRENPNGHLASKVVE